MCIAVSHLSPNAPPLMCARGAWRVKSSVSRSRLYQYLICCECVSCVCELQEEGRGMPAFLVV